MSLLLETLKNAYDQLDKEEREMLRIYVSKERKVLKIMDSVNDRNDPVGEGYSKHLCKVLISLGILEWPHGIVNSFNAAQFRILIENPLELKFIMCGRKKHSFSWHVYISIVRNYQETKVFYHNEHTNIYPEFILDFVRRNATTILDEMLSYKNAQKE
jgi:hypothetical protein